MNESPGQMLRQARELRGLSIAQAANTTRIRIHYLEALEADNPEKLPSQAQWRGMLRSYAQYLQLDPDRLLQISTSSANLPEPGSPELPERSDVVNQAQAIFREIGDKMRRQRELIGLSLEDVERHTHLRMHFLKAIELGQFESLPSSVQGRGMLNNYAIFLGFDPDPILLRFADGLQASLATRKGPRTSLPTDTSNPARQLNTMRFFSLDIWLTGIFLVGIFAFVVWAAFQVASTGSQQSVEQTPPSVVEVLAPNTPSSSPTSAQAAAALSETPSDKTATPAPLQLENTASLESSPTATIVPFSQSPVQIYIVVRQRAWARVTVDGKITFEGRVIPGGAYLYSGNERIEIRTGNGAALQLFFNRVDLGPMGILGEVVERVFTPQGMLTPTPTATPEGLPLPTETPTPTLTATTTPTPTPRP